MVAKECVSTYKNAAAAVKAISANRRSIVFSGDAFELIRKIPDKSVSLIITSPPYCIGKAYEKGRTLKDFVELHEKIFPECERILKVGGSICWQTGYQASKAGLEPLDLYVHQAARKAGLVLRNRIIWAFRHGPHASQRFSGRHEVLMWYSKGDVKNFDLDSVRVPQIYPGKKHYKGPNKGQFSGNPLGKNPGDLWEFPSVKAGHIEKTSHPCQFPVALAQRLVLALSTSKDLVMDPFLGAGTTGVAAALEKRRFIGSEIEATYISIAKARIAEAIEGAAKVRALSQGPYEPKKSDPVIAPETFRSF
jgi:adenine-specific DNA-methyltransferase